MKITTYYDDGESSNYEYDSFVLIAENDRGEMQRFSMGTGEPEDMSLSRDLSDALDVPDLMRMAYEAGKNGEDFDEVESQIEL